MELFLQKRLLGRPLTTLESECKEISILPCGLLMADPVATLPVPLYRPIRPHVSIQRAFLTSFTSLANPEKEGGEALQPNPEEIPRGAATGIILHNFLEGLPFHEMKKENSRQALEAYLTPLVAKTELAPWPEKTVDMLHASISAPLPGLGKSLLDCDPAKMIREMRFLYKNTSNDLCQGFIDLFFELDGKFYILDWKSNALPDYSQDSLETAMRSCDYFLQANLYGEAACRYLHLFGKEKQFGGAFYVFLRGGAIYFVRPS